MDRSQREMLMNAAERMKRGADSIQDAIGLSSWRKSKAGSRSRGFLLPCCVLSSLAQRCKVVASELLRSLRGRPVAGRGWHVYIAP